MQTEPHSSAAQEKFLRTLSAGMHDMAQPLSTMQASLELALLGSPTAKEYEAIAEGLLQHVGRAVEYMQFVAWLAQFQKPASNAQEVQLSVVVQEAISAQQCVVESSRIQVLFLRPENEPLVRISSTRLRQLLFYVLQVVQGCSQPEDIVQIEIQALAGRLKLRLQHLKSNNQQPGGAWADLGNPEEDVVNRAIALADAIVSSAGGEFTVSRSPFRIVADFALQGTNASEIRDARRRAWPVCGQP